MNRIILYAIAGVVVIVLLAAVFDGFDSTAEVATPGYDEPVVTGDTNAQDIAESNSSNRVASDTATDVATDAARDREPAVANSVESSRAAAEVAGAVGAEAFTVEDFDRDIVVTTINDSILSDEQKTALIVMLEDAQGGDEEELSAALTSIRTALRMEG